MEQRSFETGEGEIWLWGEREAFESDKPILLALPGAFATAESNFFLLHLNMPAAAVVVGRVPGQLCPALKTSSVGAFAAAYSEALAQLGRPAVVLAESAGALIALAMTAPNLRGMVLMEPPLMTGKAWPLFELYRLLLPRHRAFIEGVFGYRETEVEGRDYRGLLDGLKVPTYVFMGDDPLGEPRPFEQSPSLVDEPERDLMRRHPWIRTGLVRGAGHSVRALGAAKIVDVAHELLRDYAGLGGVAPP
jgi:hypothetical protein